VVRFVAHGDDDDVIQISKTHFVRGTHGINCWGKGYRLRGRQQAAIRPIPTVIAREKRQVAPPLGSHASPRNG